MGPRSRGDMGSERTRGFSIATRCETVGDFIAKFSVWTNEDSIFVPTPNPREIATECGFAILLADKKPIFGGTCVVCETFPDRNNAYKMPGMRLSIKRLGSGSDALLRELLAAKPTPMPETMRSTVVASTDTTFIVDAPRRTTRSMRRIESVQIPPLERTPRATRPIASAAAPVAVVPSAPVAVIAEGTKETRVQETRVRGSSIVLPANPFTELSDRALEGFVDCRLFEAPSALPIAEPIDAPLPPIDVAQPAPPIEAAPIEVAPAIEVAPEVAPIATPMPLPISSAIEPPARATAKRAIAKRAIAKRAIAVVIAIAAVAITWMRMRPAIAEADVPAVAAPMTVHASLRSSVVARDAAPPKKRAIEPKRAIHAVLITTIPAGAHVTIDGRSFGYTPTYAKVLADTPLEVNLTRPGFAPVVHPFTSKTTRDRVTLRLRRRS